MSADSAQAMSLRNNSDLGEVFPSGVRVGQTSYGLGVFAFAFIPGGTPIARVAGHIIHDPLYESDYCIDVGDGKVLEPATPFRYLNHSCEPNCQLMHYVNEEDAGEEDLETGELTEDEMDLDEECGDADDDGIYGGVEENDQPAGSIIEEMNETESGDPVFEDGADIWVESIQDIMPGEELTIDYAWPADKAVKCLCGKPRCRGWIVDPAERDAIE